MMRESLKRDHDILEADDGLKAMRIIETTPVDLMITDMCMPEKDGIETIRALRRTRPELKILAVSGAFDGVFLTVARALGANAILQKPFDPAELVRCVQRLLPAA
jgi:CheY-like chemotaxis protein